MNAPLALPALRDRLGAGDPATLSRAINAIEAELVRAGLADIALPDIPVEIAEQMRQLWHAAVSVQLDAVVRLKTDAEQSIAVAHATLVESALRVDVLKQELTELRALLAARDAELAQWRTDHAALAAQDAAKQAAQQELQAQLQAAHAHGAALERAQADALAEVQQRYEGLSRQLLQETAQQRQAAQNENGRLASQLKFAEKRIATLDAALARAESALAGEREKRQSLAGEANAFKAVNASRRALPMRGRRQRQRRPPYKRKSRRPAKSPPHEKHHLDRLRHHPARARAGRGRGGAGLSCRGARPCGP